MNQNHHEPLSNYAFNVKLRRYNKEVSTLLIFLVVIGVSLYFITSSDSGSYVDDVLAAQGLPNPPLIQKIFWAFTEGAVVGGRCRLTR